MNIAIFINTPAQVHFYRNIYTKLTSKGNNVYLIARDYGETYDLLKEFDLPYFSYSRPPVSKIGKVLDLPKAVLKTWRFLRNKKIDVITGFGTYDVLTSILLRNKVAVFCDSEPRINKWTFSIQFDLLKPFTDLFITPASFNQSLGKKHVTVRSFKEFSYLHPNYYEINEDIFNLLHISKGQKYMILRFNAFDALHDAGKFGFSDKMKIELVRKIEGDAKVFISSEKGIPKILQKNVMDLPKSRIHDALSFAHLLITDTQTMTTEAAILGTPVVRCNSWVGKNDMSNFIELEEKYGMIYNYRDEKEALDKVLDLLNDENIKTKWKYKQRRLLEDNEDIVEEYCQILTSLGSS